MTLTAKTFPEIVTYTRASGATRVNAAGLIVGVDFSSTSNTITTGSKTFTLTADANVNRDWPIGSSVIAVSQAGAVGTMTGTVTSYTPSTQVLVINVASITGSGTSTNWRIGSLEFRQDFTDTARTGGLVEGGATNLLAQSVNGASGYANNLNVTTTLSGIKNSSTGSEFVRQNETTASGSHYGATVVANFSASPFTTISMFLKKGTQANARRYVYLLFSNTFGNIQAVFDLDLGIVTQEIGVVGRIDSYGDGIYRVSATTSVQATQTRVLIGTALTATPGLTPAFSGMTDADVLVSDPQIEQGFVTSYIPTTTVSVTRAADLANVDGARFSQFYSATGGTAVLEITPIAAAVQAVAASFNDGTVNNAIRIAQKQSGTIGSIRKMATDGVTDVMAINAVTNTLRSNGFNYDEISDQSAQAKLGMASSGVGSFLNVGGTENFRSSDDSGLTYNARTIGNAFSRAHFGVGRFVIGSGTATINGATVSSVIVSPDGLSYRRVNIPGLTQTFRDITSNTTNGTDGSIILAVGNGGVIYASADAGETWIAQTSGETTAFNATAYGVSNSTPTFVAVNATAANSRYSTNGGVTWTKVTGLTGTMTDVCYTGAQWVAINSIGGVFTSPDGITFTAVTTTGITPAFASAQAIAFATIGGVGYYIIVGNQVAVSQASANASPTTWTVFSAAQAASPSGLNANDVCFFSGLFYISSAGASAGIHSVAYDPVANTFTRLLGAGDFNGNAFVVASPTLVLAGGLNIGIGSASSGVTFTPRTGNAATLNGSAFGNGTYVIVGNAVNGSGLIATVDPATFAYTRRVSGTTNSLNSVAAGATGYMAYGGADTVLSSPDAITWTTRTSTGINNRQNSVNYSDGRYVFAGRNGSGIGMVAIYDDTFARIVAGTTLSAMAANALDGTFVNGIYVVVCELGQIYTSTNGTAWTLRTSGTTTNLFSVMYSERDQMWYAAGDNGTIVRAADPTGTWENISNDAIAAVVRAGAVQANPFLANLVPGAINKIAVRVKPNDFAVSVNGADAVTDPSVTLPVVSQLSLGMNGVSGMALNGWIRRVQWRTTELTDAELKGLTT